MFSFIIPNFNGRKHLSDSLNSVFGQKGKAKKEVIVVDNGSGDQSLAFLEKEKKRFKKAGIPLGVIKNKKNLGFAKAINQGIQKSKYPYVVVMNNDLKIKSDWLEQIKQGIDGWKSKEKVGAYFGKVLDWSGKRIESTGLVFYYSGKALNRGNGKRNKKDLFDQEEVVWGGSASVIVYSKQALKRVGFFDPIFFAYLEDVDLAIRLNRFGFKTVYLPKAVSYHRGGATSDKAKGFRYRLVARNWWFIILKYYTLECLLKNLASILFEQFKNFVIIDSVSGKLWVLKELIIKWPKIIRKRTPIKFSQKAY